MLQFPEIKENPAATICFRQSGLFFVIFSWYWDFHASLKVQNGSKLLRNVRQLLSHGSSSNKTFSLDFVTIFNRFTVEVRRPIANRTLKMYYVDKNRRMLEQKSSTIILWRKMDIVIWCRFPEKNNFYVVYLLQNMRDKLSQSLGVRNPSKCCGPKPPLSHYIIYTFFWFLEDEICQSSDFSSSANRK